MAFARVVILLLLKVCLSECYATCRWKGRPYMVEGTSLQAVVRGENAQQNGLTTGDEHGWGACALVLDGLGEWGANVSRTIFEEALRSANLSNSPFPSTSSSVNLAASLPELLRLARAELENSSDEERVAWRNGGLAEHAAIGSFAKHSLDLLVAGAPPRLVRLSVQAQEEEIYHAHISMALADLLRETASTAGSVGVSLDFPEHTLTIRRDTKGMREAAIAEGLVGEGNAALKLFRTATDALQGSPKRVRLAELTWAMAMDETRHTALAADVLGWLESVTGQPAPVVNIEDGVVSVREGSSGADVMKV